jgi:hypothetical protein
MAENIQPVEPKEVAISRADTFRVLYANNVRGSLTPWDLQLTFGQIISDLENKPRLEELVTVAVSLHQAKALSAMLERLMKSYEADHGQINDPSVAQTSP